MKMAEILRSLADKLETIEKGDDRPANTGPTGDHFQHDVEDGAESGDKDVEVSAVMVPPLQQKLEILKKLSGEADQPDELDDIKRLTGIQTVIHTDDTDLDGQ
jgi:hypothetical protein